MSFVNELSLGNIVSFQDYRRDGLSFRYPQSWELSEEAADRQRTITLQTAGASFWTLTIFSDRPDPERVLESVLQAYRDDYDEIDVYEAPGENGLLPTVAAELDFVYLDIVNSVAVRAFQTEDLSAVVIYQGTDQELESLREK